MPTADTPSEPSQQSEDAANDDNRAQVPLSQQPGPKLFFAGLIFASFSALSTRRALTRRRLQDVSSQSLTHSQHASVNSAAQARQSASDALLSKGQTPQQSFTQAGQGTAAPGYASAASEAAQAVSHGAPNAASAEAISPAEKLQNNSAFMAFEALSLATVNVVSWAMTGVGGFLWRWDIRNLEELRQKVRGGPEGAARSEEAIERELEELVVSVLAKREDKERIRARLLKELEEESRK